MSLSFEIAGTQIDGARDYQEDAFLVTNLTDANGSPSALVIVADGMGGHAAGNVASNMAVQAFNKHVTSNYPSESLSEVLNEAVLKANHSIAETVKETPALEGMGCTMIAAVLEGNSIYWASVGDSHLYLLRNRELNKINADHSYGGFLDAMEAAGTPVEAEPGLSRNMLMSAITGSDISDIDCPEKPLELKDGDKILICSDGLDTLSHGKIIQYIDWADSSKEAADALLNAVEETDMPKQDNTTAVVISVKDKEVEKAAPAEEPEVEDEDEDITDTGYKSESAGSAEEEAPVEEIDLEDTLENIPPEEAPPEAPPEKETPPPAPGATVPRAGNKGLLIGIAAGVVIMVALAGYFLVGGEREKEEAAPPMAEEKTMEPAPVEEAETVAEEPAPVEEPVPPEAEEPAAAEREETATETDSEPVPPAEGPAVVKEEPTQGAVDGGVFRDDLKAGGKGPAMVWVPAGSFEMGSPGASRFTDERPRHKVEISKFAISQHEITFAEYDKFARATGRKIPDNQYMDRETHPVINVSWDDAYYYTRWLSEQTGETYRLPSEAEWEYAASGGENSPFWWGFDEKPGMAHCFGCGSQFDPRKPAKVGSFEPNPYGIYDTSGNVAEWVHDCWHENYEGAPSDGSVWEGGDCSQRIARGGSYISPMQSTRVTKRDKFRSDTGYDHIGIRVVREP